ncbi:hypothetical protein ACFXHA_16365 [Nocardia sp. NPDC059240]|uniref:hypothetical protein n=1 Tax=Nocardia sp. NPDC059240 TaxID=3346786 RepID=UPI0036CC5E4F
MVLVVAVAVIGAADVASHRSPASGGRMSPELHSSGDSAWLIVRGPAAIDAMRLVDGVWQKWDTLPCGTTGDLDAFSPTTLPLICGFPDYLPRRFRTPTGYVFENAGVPSLLITYDSGRSWNRATFTE